MLVPKIYEEQLHRRSGLGRRWWLDYESLDLLDEYRCARLAMTPTPDEATVGTEMDYLSGMLNASIELGGPATLRGLRDDPSILIKILRSWPRTHGTLTGMLAAMQRLIAITLEPSQASLLQDRIFAGLYPRPLDGRSWNRVPRTVGGTSRIAIRRPVLHLEDLRKIVHSAALRSRGSVYQARDQAICALYCFSGVSPGELHKLRWEQIERLDSENGHWYALIRGLPRRGRFIDIPIHQEAGLWLEAARVESQTGPLFASPRRKGAAIGDGMLKAVIRESVRLAGVAEFDNVTLKRAYNAFLESTGVSDYDRRDALGYKLMATVDRLQQAQRRRASQRALLEHSVIDLPPSWNEPPSQAQLQF